MGHKERARSAGHGASVPQAAREPQESPTAHSQNQDFRQPQRPAPAIEGGDFGLLWHATLAVAARLLLACLSTGHMLQRRIEIATPLTSLWRIREGLYLTSLGMSPYTGSAYHAAPLLLPLLRSAATSTSPMLMALPFIAADLCSALALHRIATAVQRRGARYTGGVWNCAEDAGIVPRSSTTPSEVPVKVANAGVITSGGHECTGGGAPSPAAAAVAYLWSPFTMASCAGASCGCFENAAVLVAVLGCVAADPALAAAGLATAAYLGLHPILLLAPLALIMWRGPEDLSIAAPAIVAFAHPAATDAASGPQADPEVSKAMAEGEVGVAESQRKQSQQEPQSSQAAAGQRPRQEATSATAAQDTGLVAPALEERAALAEQFQASFSSRRRPGRRRLLAEFVCWTLAWVLALAALSDLSLRLYPEHWCQGLGLGSVLRAVGMPVGVSCEGAQSHVGSDWGGVPRSQHWLWETFGFMLRTRYSGFDAVPPKRVYCALVLVAPWPVENVDDLTPNIGLQWYLMAETFPSMCAATAALCPALALLCTLALCSRLPHRPLFLAALICALSAMLKPYPSVSDVSLYMGLLPLFSVQLRESLPMLFLGSSLSLLVALGPAMWHMWIYLGSANANFYYAATLLFGAWQAYLIVSLVAATIRHDRLLAGKPVLKE